MFKDFIAYGASGTPGGNWTGMAFTLVLWAVVFYFLLIRPNKKKQKKHQDMVSNLKEGVSVITAGGIKGEVVSTTDDFVIVRVDKGVRLTVKKSSISTIYEK